MECQKCKSERIAIVQTKCSDMFWFECQNIVYEGYPLDDIGLESDIGSDFIEIKYCLDCGQMQGKFPCTGPNDDEVGRFKE